MFATTNNPLIPKILPWPCGSLIPWVPFYFLDTCQVSLYGLSSSFFSLNIDSSQGPILNPFPFLYIFFFKFTHWLACDWLAHLYVLDFCGSSEVMNPSANAGDKGLIPGLRRFHMTQEQLSLCAAVTEAGFALETLLCNKRNYCSEKPMHCN